MSDVFDFLVVGTTSEAYTTLEKLSKEVSVGRLFHLPVGLFDSVMLRPDLTSVPDWSGAETEGRTLNKAILRDQWGQSILGLDLPNYLVWEQLSEPMPFQHEKVERLVSGLSIARIQDSEGRRSVGFSDGTEIVCDALLFADGTRSLARSLSPASKSKAKPKDKTMVNCWSFQRDDLLDCQGLEYRWALGKSIELLPLAKGRVRITFRFRSPFGGALDRDELAKLFADFGSDVAAMLEGVEADEIRHRVESKPFRPSFTPGSHSLALGLAGLGSNVLQAFDWKHRLVEHQLSLLIEQLSAERLSLESLDQQSLEYWRDLREAERFWTGALHSDWPLLRKLRDLALKLLPKSYLRKKVSQRLLLSSS